MIIVSLNMAKALTHGLAVFTLFVAFAATSFFYSFADQSGEFIFAGWESEPFYFKGPHGFNGALFDIMEEVCHQENLKCIFKIYGFHEVMDKIKKGEVQAGGPFVYTFPRSSVLQFSDQLFASTYGFYALPKQAEKIHIYNDLIGHTIGVLGLSASRISLEAVNEFLEGKLKIVEEKSMNATLHNVDLQKYPVCYTNRDTAASWILKNKSSIKEIPGLGEDLEYRLAFSLRGVDKEKLHRLLATLDKLGKSGFIKKVADRYQLKAAKGQTP